MQPKVGRQGRMRLPPAGGSVSRSPTRLVLARPLTLALALVAGAARAATSPLAVPLALEESAGVARHAWPASASVPLPRGRVQSPDKLWLAAPGGRAAPLQARALERWPDGSVRWLLLDFLVDVPAGKVATFTLRDGAPPAPASGARVRLAAGRDGARVIDSGALRVSVPARGEALLADLAAGPVRRARARARAPPHGRDARPPRRRVRRPARRRLGRGARRRRRRDARRPLLLAGVPEGAPRRRRPPGDRPLRGKGHAGPVRHRRRQDARA